jgi:hypothetical protein
MLYCTDRFRNPAECVTLNRGISLCYQPCPTPERLRHCIRRTLKLCDELSISTNMTIQKVFGLRYSSSPMASLVAVVLYFGRQTGDRIKSLVTGEESDRCGNGRLLRGLVSGRVRR